MKVPSLENAWILAQECQEHLIHGHRIRFVATSNSVGGFPLLNRDPSGDRGGVGQPLCTGGGSHQPVAPSYQTETRNQQFW